MSGLSMAGIVLRAAFCQACYAFAIPGKTRDCGRNLPLVHGFLESLAGSEGRKGLGGDLDLLAVHRAAAAARLPFARQEGAESHHGDALPLGDVLDDGLEQCVTT